jgi:hypothetical protein
MVVSLSALRTRHTLLPRNIIILMLLVLISLKYNKCIWEYNRHNECYENIE